MPYPWPFTDTPGSDLPEEVRERSHPSWQSLAVARSEPE